MKIHLYLIVSLILSSGFSASGQDGGAPTASPEIKTFALQPDLVGAASNSVNLFTGDVVLPLNLISIPSHNGLDVNVSIAYNSNVQTAVDTWNLEAPTSTLGLGWKMDIPRVIADNKQTGTREDDDYYLLEGGVTSHLIRTSSGSDVRGIFYSYEIKNYKFWKIKYYYGSIELWEITKEDGTRYIYGDKFSTRSTIQYAVRWNNWIGSSSQLAGQSQLAIAWNLSEVINLWNEKITFEYLNVEQPVGASSGQKHTEASYLKQVTDVFGKKIQFFYKEKESQYYTEPHVEQAEPDAFQEVYEKKYLDHIDLIGETSTLIFSVNFRYISLNPVTNKAKMLLANIFQKNANGEVLPGIQFDYYAAGVTNGVANPVGLIHNVTYPSGSIVSYSYTPNVIGHSNLNTTIQAPPSDDVNTNGYAEPQIYLHGDYVLVAWRALGSGNTHDKSPKDVQLYVYQWVGEWKGQLLQTINNVSLVDTSVPDTNLEYYPFKDFQVILEDKFFGVLSSNGGNYYTLIVNYMDESKRANWNSYSVAHDYGSGLPTLMSGNNFIAVGASQDDSTHPSYLYTFQGNGWKEDVLNQTIGEHFYTSANNYFISHNRAGFDGKAEINFSYLKEDKKWVTKKLPYSPLTFSSSDKSYWHGSNSFAVAMAANNPEYIYRWDLSYTNFYRDDVLGAFPDNSYVFNINNSLVGIVSLSAPSKGIAARYDGSSWNASSPISAYFQDRFSFGEDYAIWDVDDRQRPVNAYFRKFDPNALAWVDQDMTFTPNGSLFHGGWNPLEAAPRYFSFLDKIYINKPDGNWSPDLTLPIVSGNAIVSDLLAVGSDKYFVYTSENVSGSSTSRFLQFVKNGAFGASLNIGQYSFWDRYALRRVNLMDVNKIITYGSSYIKDAKSLTLYHVSDEQLISGKKTSYLVTLLTENDGIKPRYTSFNYNLVTATVDPSWSTALFNEVDVVSGSVTANDHSRGYTKNFFINGLTNLDDNHISTLISSSYAKGSSYEVRKYNSDNSFSYTKNVYSIYSLDFVNDENTKVDVGFYSRLAQMQSNQDGQQINTDYSYASTTGLVTYKKVSNGASSSDVTENYYKYFWESDDPGRLKNILTPLSQTITYLNGNVVESEVTRWKNWTCVSNPTGVPLPYDNYLWRKTNTSDFSSWWNISTTPSVDWSYRGKVSLRDINTGVILEQVGVGNQITCQVWDNKCKNVIAQVANASYADVGYTSFEDGASGNLTLSDGSIISGNAKTGLKFLSLGTSGLTKSGLDVNERYLVSFWAKSAGGSVNVDGVGAMNISNSTVWQLFQNTVSGLSAVTIKTSGSASVWIDEVRIYPSKGMMNTFTYDPVYGITSQTDSNNHSQYTEYDSWGRVQDVQDENRNIVKTLIHNIKK